MELDTRFLKRSLNPLLPVALTFVVVIALAQAYGAGLWGAYVPRECFDGVSRRYSGVVERLDLSTARSVEMRVDSVNGDGCRPFILRVFLPYLERELEERDRLSFAGRIRELSHTTTLPDEVDFHSRAALRGVTAEALLPADSIIDIVPEPGLLNDIRRLRADVARILADGTVSSDAAGLLIAALTGDRSGVLPSTRDMLTSTGLAHILALSGMHVAIIAFVLSILLLPLRALGLRRWVWILTGVALWLFAVMTGLSPSVTRSVVMMTVFLLAALSGREWSPINALCLAAIIILAFNPSDLFTPGLQFSFIAVGSIIMLAKPLNPWREHKGKLRWAASLVTVPLAATLGTAILVIAYFHRFPLWFIVANVFAGLIVTPLVSLGALKVLLGMMGMAPKWLAMTIDALYSLLAGIAKGVGELPLSQISGLCVGPVEVVLYFVGLGAFVIWIYRRRPVWLIGAVVAWLAMVLIPLPVTSRREWFVRPSSDGTTILVRDEKKLLSAHFGTSAEDIHSLDSVRFEPYMLKRGIREFERIPQVYSSDYVHRHGNLVAVGQISMQFIASAPARHCHTDYAIVGAPFRGDIVALAPLADTLLLGTDIHPRRLARFERELTAARIPYRKL